MPFAKPILKQPAETLAVPVGLPVVAVAIGAVTVLPRGLVAAVTPLTATASLNAGIVSFRVAGGTDGERYLLTAPATDAAGLVSEAEAEIVCANLTFAAPDGVTPYVSIAAFVDRFGIEQSIRMTDEIGSGRIDKPRLMAALLDAQAIVDGYLAQRFAVPLTSVPQMVVALVLDLAVARLYAGGVPDGVAAAAAEARRTLRDLADGRITLPAAALALAVPASPNFVLSEGPERQFTHSRLTSF